MRQKARICNKNRVQKSESESDLNSQMHSASSTFCGGRQQVSIIHCIRERFDSHIHMPVRTSTN